MARLTKAQKAKNEENAEQGDAMLRLYEAMPGTDPDCVEVDGLAQVFHAIAAREVAQDEAANDVTKGTEEILDAVRGYVDSAWTHFVAEMRGED